jgi:hypothetical protein
MVKLAWITQVDPMYFLVSLKVEEGRVLAMEEGPEPMVTTLGMLGSIMRRIQEMSRNRRDFFFFSYRARKLLWLYARIQLCKHLDFIE